MSVTSLFPAAAPFRLGELRDGPAGDGLTVADDRIVDFLVRLGRALLAPALTRAHPELAPLGFFLRRIPVTAQDEAFRVPRGLVFHVPPANVDTVFAYCWALSAFAGNRNVVRISARAGDATRAVLGVANELLSEVDGIVARTQRVIGYGHDDTITAALSEAADLRVIWGGDESVRALRRFPLAPHARDLTFPDRSSFAVVSVPGWRRATVRQRRAAVEKFRDDTFWFDQAACSSPRGVFWIGDPAQARCASREFRGLLTAVVAEKGHRPDAAMAVHQRVSAYGAAADGRVRVIDFDSAAVVTLELTDPSALPREWLGAGVFTHSWVESLDELRRIVCRKDQTITHFGFDRAELVAFAGKLAGCGVDRIVPFGSALTFSPVWDGYDLLAELTKVVTVAV
jgi:hypothetical protein